MYGGSLRPPARHSCRIVDCGEHQDGFANFIAGMQ